MKAHHTSKQIIMYINLNDTNHVLFLIRVCVLVRINVCVCVLDSLLSFSFNVHNSI